MKNDIAITKMSSKGQIVIPIAMREEIIEGEKLLIIKRGSQFIIKRACDLDKDFADDLKFAEKTEKAWQRIEAGHGVKMDFDEFIEEMKTW